MRRQKKKVDRIGATPGKLALIGILAIVLAIVIIQQLPGDSEQSLAAQQPPPGKNNTKANSSTENKSDLLPWPNINLGKTLEHDPFVMPTWLATGNPAAETQNENSAELTALKQQGASIVIIASDQKAATVGNYQVKVGDVVDGYQITDITTDGILLNKIQSH